VTFQPILKENEFHQLSSPAFFENKNSTSLFASSIQNYLEANQLSLSPLCVFVKCKHIFFTNLYLEKFLDNSKKLKLILKNCEMEAQ